MAQTTTGTTNFDKTLTDLIQMRMEPELRPSLPHLLDGNYRPAKFVKGTNNTMRFLRMADLAVDINGGTVTPGTQPWLTEGVAPDAEALSFGYEEFSAYQAGRRVEITDLAALQSPNDLSAIASEKIALNGAQTADAFVAYTLGQGANVLYAGDAVSTVTVDNTDVIDATLLRRVRATLKRDNVPTFADGFYRAIIEPGVVFDIQSDTEVGGWIDASRYAGSMPLLTNELGRFAGIRFVESSNAFIDAGAGAAGIDVYSTLVFGPEAYAFGDWGTITGHYVAPGGHGDELAQVASIGWKGRFGCIILDEAGPRYVRVESGTGL